MKEKIINYNHPYFNNMLNSTKTWREEFNENFNNRIGKSFECCDAEDMLEDLKQFISDLRKKDMEALIKMLPESEHSLSHIYCEEMREQGFQGCKTKVKQLIKDYYEK